jgi:LuxR family maltose regulon positive regulatory protein
MIMLTANTGWVFHTKIIPPALPAHWARRPRLLQALTGAQSITLIAPNLGMGKTLLLADYIDYVEHPVAWLSLDSKDNFPGRLLRYLLASFQQSGLLAEPSCDISLDIPPDQWEAVQGQLSNCLQSSAHSRAIVLDNLEKIRSPQALKILQQLLDVANSQLRWFLLARGNPIVNFAKLRAANRLTELTFDDMAFNVKETEALCIQSKLVLPADELYKLENCTRGWAIGLQLWLSAYKTISATRSSSVIARPVARLAYEYLAQYMIEEIVSPLNIEQRRFMRRTIVADRFTVELANVLYRGNNAEKILPKMVQAGTCFVVGQDNEDHYRYPGLVADVLSQYWKRIHGDSAKKLHRAASDWYLNHGLVNDAIYQAMQGDDINDSLQIMQLHLDELVSAGLAGPAERQSLDTLLPNPISNDATLTLIDATLAISIDDGLRGKACISQLKRHILETPEFATRLMLESMVLMLRCLNAHIGGNNRYCMNLSVSALRQSHEASTVVSAMKFMEARSAFSLGLLSRSEEMAEQALQEYRQWHHLGYSNKVVFLLVQIQLASGRLSEATMLAQDSMAPRPETTSRRDYFRIHRDLALALIHWESNKLENAHRYFQRAMKSAIDLGHDSIQSQCYYHLGCYYFTCRDDEKVIDLCQEGRRIAVASHQGLTVRLLDTLRTRVALRQGDMETARLWLNHWNRYRRLYGPDTLPEEKALYAWIQTELKNLHEASHFSSELIHQFTREKQVALVIDMHLLQARVFDLSNDAALSYAALNKAVSLARDTGLVRAFCESTPGLIEQLKGGIGRKKREIALISPDNLAFVEEVLLPAMAKLITPEHIDQISPIASLTKRELNVLDLMVQDNSNPEIAETLFIGVSTVKTHVSNILSKLNVDSRKEAIKKAQSAKLG